MKKNSPKSNKAKLFEQLLGRILRQLRQERGLSQEELGLESGYHRTYISQLERGQKNPSIRTIFQLAKALEVEPSEIVERIQALAKPRPREKRLTQQSPQP